MITISNMKAGYGGSPVISVPSLEIKKGCITGIIGKNGSGKSTLIKAIDAQIKYSGSIMIDDNNLNNLSHIERACRIAYLPQHLNIVRMKVETLVSHGRYAYTTLSHNLSAKDIDIIEYAMELADVKKLRDRYIEELSGGERSRAYLAMIIAQDSDYILLDEPTSDYDIAHQNMIIDILSKLANDGKGIIICIHDILLALTVSDSIVMIRDGNILATKTPSKLIEDDSMLRECVDVGVAISKREDSLYRYQLIR